MYTINSFHGAPLDEPVTLPVGDAEAWAAAEEMGIDIFMLYENAQASPEQRMRAHAQMLASAEALQTASRARHGRT